MGYGKNHYKARRNKSRNKKINKALAVGGIIAIFVIAGIIINTNYDVTLYDKKIDEYIPVETIERNFNDLYESIPIETLEDTFDEFSESIPVKIEEKPETLESKLKDCSVYKKNYLDSYNDVKSTPDNMAAMIGDALPAIAQTRACEAYNDKVYQEFGELGHCNPPALTFEEAIEEPNISYKERFIKYCGQAEWDYLNEK